MKNNELRNKKLYTSEFKEEAIKLVLKEGYSQSEAAKRLGICPKRLNYWIKIYHQQLKTHLSPSKLSGQEKELLELRKENKRLKLEREILKKAAAFFVSESSKGMNL